MTCPICDRATKVIDTTSTIDVVYRKRRCTVCGYTFCTEEVETLEKFPGRRRKDNG